MKIRHEPESAPTPESPAPSPAAPIPSLVGMTPEMFQALMSTLGSVSAESVKQTLRLERRENPYYHERSVFNPDGKFDAKGAPIDHKPRLRRDTFYMGVVVGRAGADAELCTPEEVELFNRFADDRTARDGKWSATIDGKGTSREVLKISLGSVKSVDERMGLPPLVDILRELLDGPEAVSPVAMSKRIADLEAKIRDLERLKVA